ncbi:MAG: T9SS type A sorting domain-containing protein [Bacteroidota bacterium]
MNRLLLVACLFLATHFYAFAQPANDDCSNAIAISLDTDVEFSTLGASDVGPNVTGCGAFTPAENDSIPADIWYTYTATADGFLEWTNCGTADFDSRMAVYETSDPCMASNMNLVNCNDDGPDCDLFTSSMLFSVTSGQTYALRLGGFGDADGSASGTGTVRLIIRDDLLPNDFCDNAFPLSLGEGQQFSTVGATTDGPNHPGNAECFGFNSITAGQDIWYDYTADFTGTVRMDFCGMINYDSRVAIYAPGSSCPPLADDLLACNDDGAESDCASPNFHSDVFFDVVNGETYKIRIGGFGTETGSGTFDFIAQDRPEPPSNDLCDNAIPIDVVSYEDAENGDGFIEGTTVAATINEEAFVTPGCTNDQGSFHSVWYSFESGGNEEVQVALTGTLPGSNFIVELFTECGTRIDTTGGNNCFFVNPDDPFVTDTVTGLPAGENATILIRVMTYSTFDPTGPFALQIAAESPSSVSELTSAEDIKLFPNPTSGVTNLSFNLSRTENLEVAVFDLLGRPVSNLNLGRVNGGRQQIELPTDQLASGMYTVVLSNGQAQRQLKLVVR